MENLYQAIEYCFLEKGRGCVYIEGGKNEQTMHFFSSDSPSGSRNIHLVLKISNTGGRRVYWWEIHEVLDMDDAWVQIQHMSSYVPRRNFDILKRTISGLLPARRPFSELNDCRIFYKLLESVYKEVFEVDFPIKKKEGFKQWSDFLWAEDGTCIPAGSLG